MPVQLVDGQAQYHLAFNTPIGDKLISLNDKLGQTINLSFKNAIYCTNCGALTRKSYSQGHCYLCAQSLASCDLCIMKPETCHYHLGTCREPQWGLDHCFSEHIVYLANSSGIKVGITRASNMPMRWIDQGAISALPILSINTRLESGQLEVQFKAYIADKTNWRKMLKNEVETVDLEAMREQLLPKIDLLQSTPILEKQLDISYPVLAYPQKITSLNFDKTPDISGKLMGVKGQYLLLDTGVLNVRKFGSYLVGCSFGD